MPDYRGIQECYWLWAPETAGGAAGKRMLAPSATTFPAASGFQSLGYSAMPSINLNEQPVPVMSLGSYRLLNSYKGIRNYSIRAEITVGHWAFLRRALRKSGDNVVEPANAYKGLPVMAIAFGSMDQYSDPFNYVARYCMIRELSLTYAPGQPLRASVDFMPLFIEFTASQKTLSEAQVLMAGGEILGWDNMSWLVGNGAGVDYSHWLTGASLQISNGIEPIGQRRNLGDNNPLSRVPRALVPTNENVSANYNLAAEIEPSLYNELCNSTQWGKVQLNASNLDGCGSKEMNIAIAHNRLSSFGIQGGQIGQTLSFSASTLSGIVAIEGSG